MHVSARTPIRRPLAVKAAPRRRTNVEPVSTHRQCATKLTGEGRRLALTARAAMEYELESIVDERTGNGGTQYLVHWLGYTENERTWERLHTIQHTDVYKAHIARAPTNQSESSDQQPTNRAEVSASVNEPSDSSKESMSPAATVTYVFVHPAATVNRMPSNAEQKEDGCVRTVRYRPKCHRECQLEDDQAPFSQHNSYHNQHRRRRIITDTDESDED
jgi:hypothetical protein